MKHKERIPGYLALQFLFIVSILSAVTGCLNSGGLSEFHGVVVGKRDSNQILVVPNIDADTVRNKTAEELLAMAQEQNGVYFSVDPATFENATVGTRVVVYYDPDDGEEVAVPTRRHARRAEILTD